MEFAAMTAFALIAILVAGVLARPEPKRVPVRIDRRDRRS